MNWHLVAGLAGVGIAVALLGGCGSTRVPEGCRPVTGFEVERYLGTWHEVHRIENRFERGLSRCSAEYRLRPDGRVEVVNRGFRDSTGRWEKATGVAAFLGDSGTASLKVSFFGPFWGGYHVLALDPAYRAALVAGSSRDYLWILCRDRKIDPGILERFLAEARAMGFPTDRLVSVDQSDAPSMQPSGSGAPGGSPSGERVRREEWDR